MKSSKDMYRTLIFMFLFIISIQLSTLIYIWKFGSRVLVEKERKNLNYQLDIDAELLLTQMNSLQKELQFLSILEVMDDIIVKDIDKRITILLEKKAKDLSQNIILEASSKTVLLSSSIKPYTKKNFLLFQVPLYASFDKDKKIGKLSLLYPLENLTSLEKDNPHQKLWLTPPFKREVFFQEAPLNSIVISKKLNGILKNWKLSLSYEKAYALETIHKIENILIIAFLLSLLLLLFTVWKASKKQITILKDTNEMLALKRIFLSTMSHELRTPLASILNLTQHLMIRPHLKDDEVEMLIRIEKASEHLLGMINTLLELSKLESKTIKIKKESVDIVSLIEEMIEIVSPLMDEKGLVFKKDILIDSTSLITDTHLFQQIVINLLSNAIKFTQQGEITLSLRQTNHQFRLSILDTGIGIAPDKQKELFNEFYQAHQQKREDSSGLGLALSQKMASYLNGDIKIKSKGLDLGTEAIFTFSAI